MTVPPNFVFDHVRNADQSLCQLLELNLTSTTLVVSVAAGSNFHRFTASLAALTNTGCPPNTLVLFTRPLAVTTTSIFTVPEIDIFRARSGYVGWTLTLTLRDMSSWAKTGEGRDEMLTTPKVNNPANNHCEIRRKDTVPPPEDELQFPNAKPMPAASKGLLLVIGFLQVSVPLGVNRKLLWFS